MFEDVAVHDLSPFADFGNQSLFLCHFSYRCSLLRWAKGEEVFLDPDVAGPGSAVGRIYTKAVYREYTADASYSIPVPGPAYLGTLGPILYAEVGDTIKVHLKNAMSINVSIHPHGVKHAKDSEGAFKVYDADADNAAEWIFHCHVEDHVAAGMATNVTIE